MSTSNTTYIPTVSDEQIEQYRADGFIQIDNLISSDALIEMREAVATAVSLETLNNDFEKLEGRDAAYAKIFNQKVNLWQRHPRVAKFTLSSTLAGIAARLEGCPMRVWHDQALFKEPGKGNNKTPWHQDAVYWPHEVRQHQTTIWIALDDVTIESGCMAFMPGSHKLGTLRAVDLAKPHDIFHDSEFEIRSKPVVKPLKAGSVTFHNGLTLHFAGSNKADFTRRAFAIIYMPDGTVYDGGPHIVTDGQGFMPGDQLNSALFPSV